MIFDDFHGFSRISSFLRIVLNASRRQMASKRVHFHAFAMDLISFRMKIHEISAFGGKRYRNVPKSVPDVKFSLFCKALRGCAPNMNF